ncbi:septin 2 [Podila epicladia]|nr:septin 2 [Podila epicladia]
MTVDLDSLGMDDTSSTAASLRFLLLGDVGVGKSDFVDAFVSTLAGIQSNLRRNESIPAPITSATQTPSPIHLEAVHVTTKPILQHDDTTSPFDDHLGLVPPKVSIPARELTFATIPGYSSTVNPSSVLTMTDDYLNHHLHSATSIFSPSISSSQLAWFLIAGSRAHTLPTCAFYFVLYELKPIDILYMKMIHEKVNLVPIITKADTLSQNELWVLKRRMVRQLKLNGIKIHTFGHDMDAVERMVDKRQWGGAPFVVSTRRNSEGRLYKSELQDLVNIALYERVRHLQEDAAQKVVAWKKAFGPVGNVVKTSVEQVWAEKETPTVTAPLRRRDTRPTGLATMTIASPTQVTAPPSVLQAQPPTTAATTTTSPPPTMFSTTYAAPPSSVAYAPPPSSAAAPVDLANPANFGLPAGNYAPPPSFTSGSATQYTAPPSLATTSANTNGTTNGIKPAALNMASTYNGSSIGMISPPPSSSNGNPFAPSSSYAPPPRTTSSSSVSNQARLTLMQNPGMTIDGSTRPSELIDDHVKTNGATSPSQDSTNFMENYVVQPGSEASVSPQPAGGVEKVEIPNSEMSYQPSASETTADLSNTLPMMAQLQQQPSFLTLPSFQTPTGAFLIPPSDLYQAAMSTASDYASNIPDIWEAAELGDLATVQLHLNNGVSPDQRNNSRSTLLHRTAWQGVQPYAVMKLLISYGANVNLVNENGNTVLQNVLMKHDDPSLIKLLLDNGAEAMVTNKEGMNTLEVAALFNKLESARYLLENDMSSSDPQSITNALQRARSPDKKAMKTLLKSWQGREGERKRFELADRLRGGHGGAGGQHAFLQQQPNQSSDAASIRSFETTKGEGKSSKWLKLKF